MNFYQTTYDGTFYYEFNPDGSLTGYDTNADGSIATDANGVDLVSYDSGGYVTGVSMYGTPPDPNAATSATFPPPAYQTPATGIYASPTINTTTGSTLLSQAIADIVGGIAIPGITAGTAVPTVSPTSSMLSATSTTTLLLLAGAAYFLFMKRG